MKRYVVLMLCLMVAMLTSNASANLLSNGGFESPDVTLEDNWPKNAATDWSHWNDYWLGEVGSSAYEGTQVVEPANGSSISQSVSVPALGAGEQYTVSVQGLSPGAYESDSYLQIWLGWGGTEDWIGADFTISTPDTWELLSLTLDTDVTTAALGATMLTVEFYCNDGVAIQLDDAVLVPEPATMTLLLFGGLALVRRRR